MASIPLWTHPLRQGNKKHAPPLRRQAGFGVGRVGKQGGNAMKYLLLLVPCVLALLTPLYNSVDPVMFGLPFFYFYLLALVPISSLFVYLAWKVER
jgi:hypothetical protein